VYPIAGLGEDQGVKLIQRITESIRPTTWEEVGGPGTISAVSPDPLKVLVVLQTPDVHREVGDLLDKLREKLPPRPVYSPPKLKQTIEPGRAGGMKLKQTIEPGRGGGMF
ncbi:MAG: hypothetical protein V3R99_09010, partial [Thermoguttaceae bacterium]